MEIISLEASRIFAFLLAFLPAILNIVILLYIFKKLPRNLLTSLFTLWVIGLISWQVSDMILKLNLDAPTAHLVSNILWFPSVSVAPIGLHFALLFTNKRKIENSPIILFLIYAPLILFEVGARAGIVEHSLTRNDFWGWILAPTDNLLGKIELNWVIVLTFVTFLILLHYAIKMRNNTLLHMQTLLLAIGYAIPVIQGSITQVVFPYVLNIPEVPVTSFFMTFFSSAAFLALTRYELLNFTPEYASSQVIKTMTDAVCIIDQDKRILMYNDHFKKIIPGSLSEIQGMYLDDLSDIILMKEISMEKELPATYEVIYQNDRLEDNAWLVRENAIFNKENVKVGSSILLTDIRLRVIAERKLKERNNELSIFLYRTSHDLRAPLSTVMGLVALIKDLDNKEEVSRYLSLIDYCTQHLDNILSELLQLAVIIQVAPNAEKIELLNEVNIIVDDIKKMYPDLDKALTVRVDQPSNFYSDLNFIKPIIKHLLLNALIFNKNITPKIILEIQEESSGINIIVSDNGEGMDKEITEKAFDMFYRGSNLSKGSGIGLFIVKKAIEELNGAIALKSVPGKGTTAKVYIPTLKKHEKHQIDLRETVTVKSEIKLNK